MSGYWNLANKNDAPIDYKQFVMLTNQFKEIAEHEFATPCAMKIRLMKSVKANDNFDMSFALPSSYEEINQAKVTFETDQTHKVDEEKWSAARYVDVSIQPFREDKPGFASVEFKGELPQAASFYAQHYNEHGLAVMKQHMMASNKKMLVGDGMRTNSGGYGPVIFARNENDLLYRQQEARQRPMQSFAGFVFGALGFSS